MHDGGVDGVFRDIAADAEIVVVACLLGQPPALLAHLMGGLPCAGDHLTHPAHGLAVGRDYRKCAHIMQDVFGGNGFAADAAFSKGHIFGDAFVEVMADHQHIKMFFHRVDRIGHGRVGRGGQDVLPAHHLHDVRRMAAPCPFGVKGMDSAALEGGECVLNKAGFIQRVGVDHHLHIHRIGDAKAAVDGGGGGAPVFM